MKPTIDMLSLIDTSGKALYRVSNPEYSGDTVLWDPVIKKCLEKGTLQSSTELFPISRALAENPALRERTLTPIIKTPQSIQIDDTKLSHVMIMRVACPIRDKTGNVIGVLAGGTLINKDYSIVDEIKKTVYSNEKYRGLDMGFATIFQGGVRISTNVMTDDGMRAIGTTVSNEVYKTVIEKGNRWIGRAFVCE